LQKESVYGDKGLFRNEPVWDWTVSEHLKRFIEALDKVRTQFPCKVTLSIDGRRVATKKGIHSKDPNDPGQVVGVVILAGKGEAERAITAAKEAFHGWRDTDPHGRAEYPFKAGAVARKMRRELAPLQVCEVGKN